MSGVRLSSSLVWLVPLLMITLVGCGDEESSDLCSGRTILPHQSPAVFGQMFPLGTRDIDVVNATRVPFEWVLLLQAPCEESVTIEKVCLIGEDAKEGDDVAHFILEGPVPGSASAAEPAAVRITYDREEPVGTIDNVALVIQSNASNYPTLVVPICAQTVADGEERVEIECTSPVMVDEGEAVDLCP